MNIIHLSNIQNVKSSDHIRFVYVGMMKIIDLEKSHIA